MAGWRTWGLQMHIYRDKDVDHTGGEFQSVHICFHVQASVRQYTQHVYVYMLQTWEMYSRYCKKRFITHWCSQLIIAIAASSGHTSFRQNGQSANCSDSSFSPWEAKWHETENSGNPYDNKYDLYVFNTIQKLLNCILHITWMSEN